MEELLKIVQQYGLLERLSRVEFYENKIKTIEFLPSAKESAEVEQQRPKSTNPQIEIENTLFYAG